jgi:hypothetical protein
MIQIQKFPQMSNSIQSRAIVGPLSISSRLALIEGLLPDPNSMLFKKKKKTHEQWYSPYCGPARPNVNTMLFKQTRK